MRPSAHGPAGIVLVLATAGCPRDWSIFDDPAGPSGGGSEVISSGESSPSFLVGDADAIVWTNEAAEGAVVQCDPSACGETRTVLASDQAGPREIARLGDDLAWLNRASGTVMSLAAGSAAAVILASGEETLCGPALTATRVYWGDELRIAWCGKGGCEPAPYGFAVADHCAAVVESEGDFFWLAAGSVWGCWDEQDQCDGVELATDQVDARALGVDQVAVYWVADGAVRKISRAEGDVGTETPETLASGLEDPRALALDGTHVYWTDAGLGSVMRIAKTGGDPEPVATEQVEPHGIALGTTHVVWTNRGAGAIVRAAKSE